MGSDKAALIIEGRSLLARAIDACADCSVIVVVAADTPADVEPSRVTRTLEDPPFGGPVAGLAAGLAALPPADPGDEVLVLACDLPRVAAAVRTLIDAPLGPDGSCLADADGRPSYLTGRYRRAALRRAVPAAARNLSVTGVLSGLRLHAAAAPELTDDLDTPEQAVAAEATAPASSPD